MKNIILIVCLFSFALKGLTQTTPSIPFIKESIKIDGNLDESVWQDLPVHSDFNNFYPDDNGKAENTTEVKLFHNGINLYISATYYDTTNTAMISSLKRDDFGGIVLGSDNFQVVIDTYNKKSNGYFFSVNTSNAQLDGLVSFNGSNYSMNSSWSTVWKSKTGQKGNLKFFEIEVPLKALNFNSTNSLWALNFILRDKKLDKWMTYTKMSSNYYQHDLRTTKTFKIEKLPKTNTSKFIITPSISYNYYKDEINNDNISNFKPSLDTQFSITSSLKLDLSINPDFSQIEVDQQVTNLTRFSINLPEKRNFFLENSDLFSNLGTDEVNPFYSRQIGSKSDIQFGVKLSGNISAKSRIGILDVQTENKDFNKSQNYGVAVFQQQLSKRFTTTAFLVNRQETDKFKLNDDYNSVVGLNLNYKSINNKWTGLSNFGKSFSNNIKSDNNFYNLGINYSTRKNKGNISYLKADTNYLTDVGFASRLYNYDALNNISIREGFSRSKVALELFAFPKNSKKIQTFRYFFPSNTTYFDLNGKVTQSLSSINQALWFKDNSSVYINYSHEYVNLKYGFDPFGNGNQIIPDTYNFGAIRVGYNSVTNKKLSYGTGLQYGTYYNGNRLRFYNNSTYRLLPFAKLGFNYELNYIDLKELGSKAFNLAGFTGEVFFNNRLNWTTYVQYNTQQDNINVNSRLQWEYKPLSHLYIVVTDNFNKAFNQKNWGISFKMNYRFDI